jgi:DNA processing protein
MNNMDNMDNVRKVSSTASHSVPDAVRLIAIAALPGMTSVLSGRLLRAFGLDGAWHALTQCQSIELPRDGSKRVVDPPTSERPTEPAGYRLDVARVEKWSTVLSSSRTEQLAEVHERGGVLVTGIGSGDYPDRLLSLPEPPGVLFYKGSIETLGQSARRIAIVGTRHCSAYGREMAKRLGRDLTGLGVSVVSGLAKGIDGMAHEGALSAGGSGQRSETLFDRAAARPIGVTGSGLDHVYPVCHTKLWGQIADRGVLLSEWPLGTAPDRFHFPQRNRIVVGLSEAVVVVESGAGGGSMITAGLAADLGVPVFAVPGSALSGASIGTNNLIFDGARLCRSAEEVVGVLDGTLVKGKAHPGVVDARREPTDEECMVLRVLHWDVLSIDQLLGRLCGALGSGSSSSGRLLLLLHELEFAGWVGRGSEGWFQRAPGR